MRDALRFGQPRRGELGGSFRLSDTIVCLMLLECYGNRRVLFLLLSANEIPLFLAVGEGSGGSVKVGMYSNELHARLLDATL